MTRLAGFTLFALLACELVAADSPDARFLQGLRERRLFDLAEHYCHERLRTAQQSEVAEADLTLELIRTLALHAASSPPEARGPLWAKARSIAAGFLRRSPPSPRVLLVRVQDALSPLALGELARQEFEAGALTAEQLEPARQALREATSLLEAIDKDLVREIPLRRRAPPRAGELSADELLGLSYDVQQQLARAERNRALLADRGSDDRRALLLAAIATLNRPLSQLSADEPLRPLLQLDLAECLRLVGQLAEARELARALDVEGTAPAARLRARAELIRVALASRDSTAALAHIEQGRSIDGHAEPVLDFAWFEAFLALANSANAAQATKYQALAAEQAKSLDETHGPYWGRRADQLLLAALPLNLSNPGGGNVDLLTRKADRLFGQQKYDEAIAAYGDAASAARTAGNLNGAFELAYKAALVEQQRGRHAAASSRLRTLAKGLATHAQAPAAHLLAAWNAGQAAHGDPQAAKDYAELLHEHLELWPTAESTPQARLWQGGVAESSSDWTAAIASYAGIPRESPHYPAALNGLANCWRQRLAELSAAEPKTNALAADAIQTFTAALRGSTSDLRERWTDADRTAALALAELIIAYAPMRAAEAEQALRAALATDPPEQWQLAAQTQLVVVLAAQTGREAQAAELLRQISAASPGQLLAVVKGLSQVAARSSKEGRQAIASAQLAATKLLTPHRQQLPAADQLAVSVSEAKALAASGRRGEALTALAQLAKAHPDRGSLQITYGELLLDTAEAAELQQALGHWRWVAGKSQPRSPQWQQAKHSVALALFKLGDREAAATLLRYVLQTPPGIAGEWEPRYRELLRQCEAVP